MSAEMKFEGTLKFSDEDELAEAIADAGALLDDEPELAELLNEETAIDVGHLRVSIDIDLSGPADWFFTLEGIVEAFADRAVAGSIACWYDGEEQDPYEPA